MLESTSYSHDFAIMATYLKVPHCSSALSTAHCSHAAGPIVVVLIA